MTGMLPSRTRVFDNAAEFAADLPTFAHHLRRAGYRVALSGKMHFVGPDQLHGFEERLTTDIYPADFGWTPDWRRPGERIDWWYHNLGSVTGAGVAEITNQLEYDDEVTHEAKAKLYDLSRGADTRPWCLTVSFTHPHDPYVNRRRYWDLYEGSPALDTANPDAPDDPHSVRILAACDAARYAITPEQVRRARRGYFSSISCIDDRIGEILAVLDATQQEAAILFVSDHGDMLGERGLWFKMSFREGSARVPMMLAAPGLAPGRCDTPVSTLDVLPTLCDLAGVEPVAVADWADGESLFGVAGGGARGPVPMEYAAEGSVAPMVALVDGVWKFCRAPGDPDQLFRLDDDPEEVSNLAGDPAHGQIAGFLAGEVERRWDLKRFDAEVRESQARRLAVYAALRSGDYYPWDWQPLKRASERYMRNHMDLNVLEEAKRFPRGE
jgi:choline-sulfatase